VLDELHGQTGRGLVGTREPNCVDDGAIYRESWQGSGEDSTLRTERVNEILRRLLGYIKFTVSFWVINRLFLAG
jgi:hypothetical protein